MRTTARTGGTHIRLLIVALCIAATFATAAHAQTSEVVTYYHADAIGSIRMITDANGQVIERHDYLPFGEEWQPPASESERRLFAGQERDQETSLDYFGARFYASTSGRFLTVDPNHVGGDIYDPQRWNAYAYARGNPLRFIDPFGFDSCPAVTDTSSCVEGGAPTADFVTNFAWYLFVKSVGIVASLDNPPPGVSASSPFVAPMSGRGALVDLLATRSAAAAIDGGVLRTFLGGQAQRIVLQDDLTVVRIFDKIPGLTGGTSDMGGRFFTTTRLASRAQAQKELALGGFNQASFVESAVIPKGTVIYSGTAAPLGNLPGGAVQIFVPNISEVQFYGVRPLR